MILVCHWHLRTFYFIAIYCLWNDLLLVLCCIFCLKVCCRPGSVCSIGLWYVWLCFSNQNSRKFCFCFFFFPWDNECVKYKGRKCDSKLKWSTCSMEFMINFSLIFNRGLEMRWHPLGPWFYIDLNLLRISNP